MARHNTVLLAVLVLALAASAYGGRSSVTLDLHREASPRKTWQKCHDALASKFHAARNWHQLSMPMGLRHAERAFSTHAHKELDFDADEGIACTWEEIFAGLELCTANWKQLNRTLTPANDVSRATVNFFSKGYVCGIHDDQDECAAVPHCQWNEQWGMCGLSSFYFSLVFACRASTVRSVSICIDYDEDQCAADGRCKWLDFDGTADDICLPTSVPADWTALQIDSWLFELFTDDSKFYTNWGDCPTSHAWQELTACQKHPSEDTCGQDALCNWVPPINACTLKPDKMVDVLWGGDLATFNMANAREIYCHKFRKEGLCLRAMPNSLASAA